MKNRGVDSLHMFKSLFSHYLQILLYECSRIRGLHNIIMCKIIKFNIVKYFYKKFYAKGESNLGKKYENITIENKNKNYE
jgi:hypothetical protein